MNPACLTRLDRFRRRLTGRRTCRRAPRCCQREREPDARPGSSLHSAMQALSPKPAVQRIATTAAGTYVIEGVVTDPISRRLLASTPW